MSRYELDDEQMWEFDCKGFLNIKRFVEDDLVEQMLEAASTYRREHYTQNNGLIEKHPAFYRGMFHPGIDAISRQMFGDYRIKGHVLVINPARTGGKVGMVLPAWHHDSDHGEHPYHATAWPCPLFQLRFFIALSNLEEQEHGGLAFYPGSHRTRATWPFEGRTVPEGVAVPGWEKGDCLIMHHAIKHTALPNRSDRDRMTIQYLTSPVWVRSADAERLSPEFLDQMPEGDRNRILVPKW